MESIMRRHFVGEIFVPLEPSAEFLDWVATRWRLTERETETLKHRAAQLSHKEVAARLGLHVGYVRQVQAHILTHINRLGGHAALMRWLAEEYAAWDAIDLSKRAASKVEHSTTTSEGDVDGGG